MAVHKFFGGSSVRVISRRDATITIFNDDGELYVEKKYLSTYTISQEIAAYAEVDRIVKFVANVDVAEIVDSHKASNSLYLRYISGDTLAARFSMVGLEAALLPVLDSIIEVFKNAYLAGVAFDSDPSNFMICDTSKRVVIIDPVAQIEQLRHAAVVIFLFGLVKYRLRHIYRFNDYLIFLDLWRRIVSSYLLAVGVDRREIYMELHAYSEIVAKWNREKSGNENLFMRWFRVTVLSRIWRVLGWLFLHISRGKKC